MSRNEIMDMLVEALEVEEEDLTDDVVLSELETWDSVAVLTVIAFMDEKLNRHPHASEIGACKTVKDLIDFVNA